MSYIRSQPVLRFMLIFCFESVALVAGSVGQAFASSTASPPRTEIVPRAETTLLQQKQAAGWKLTEFGKVIASGAPVAFPGSSGTELVATTDSPAVVQSDQAQASRSLATAVHCTSSRRSLAMTAGTGFICVWGEVANINWTSQYGYAATRWTDRDAEFQEYTLTMYRNCDQQGCIWYSWHTPAPDREVRFGEVESPVYARIDDSWCG